ncbi:MAG: hypothetical protein M0011_05575 [Elusimicrobia bacterium]|nr:hypothetical protein [Elusimicrobiota bacterium]
MGLFFLFGFFSLLAQTVLLRGAAQVFGAHELSLSAALGFWLLWTAAGATRGARLSGEGAFRLLAAVLPAAAALNLLAARLAPALLSPLSQPGLFTILAGSALLILPAALANGLAAGAALRGVPSRFYAAEAAGAAGAGAFSILYYRHFPGVDPLLVLLPAGLGLAAACALVRPRAAGRALAAAGAAAVLGLAAAYGPKCWRLKPPAPVPAKAVQTEGSMLYEAGRGLVYEDGRLLHAPEDTSAEELVHIPLLTGKRPLRVLLVGGGAFFALPEVLKHAPQEVDIAEPDRFKAEELESGTGAKPGSFRLLREDPREMAGRSGRYSAVIQAAGAPENAAQNRLYTLEYFRKAASLLSPGGLFVFQLPFSENYVPPQTAYTAASVLASARAVFPSVQLLPGSRLTVIASSAPVKLSVPELAAEYSKRRLRDRAVVPSAFPFLLDPYRRAWAAAEIERVKAPPLNTDLNPLAYFRFWRSWLSMVLSPSSLLGLAALAAAGIFLAWKLKSSLGFRGEERTGEAFLMGFWGLALETAALLAFQARTGRLSPELGAMFSLFMAGAAAGAWSARNAGTKTIAATEAAAAVLALAAAAWPELAMAPWTARALLLCAGALSGAFFSAAALKNGPGVYSWDLIGGAAGGLAAAAFAAPIAGVRSAFVIAALAAAAALAGGYFFSSKASTPKE